MHWLLHVLGLDTQQSAFYNFHSGVGPELLGATSLGLTTITVYMVFNCHEWGCWRVGRYQAAGGQHRTCRRHNPEPAVRDRRPGHIHLAHREHLERQARGQ